MHDEEHIHITMVCSFLLFSALFVCILYSHRRDSFITHRAFCDALAEESSRSMAPHPQTAPNSHPQIHGFHHHPLIPHLKQETLNFSLPPWLSSEPNNINPLFAPIQENHPNPNPSSNIHSALFPPSSSLMSATALLQKAAQMGVTMSSKMGLDDHDGDGHDRDQSILSRPHHHVGAPGFCATTSTPTTAGLPSREEMGSAAFVHGLAAYGGKLANLTAGCMEINNQENVNNLVPSTSGFDAFDDSFNGIFSAKRSTIPSFQQYDQHLMGLRKEGGAAVGGGGGDGLTRDFLGLRAFPHRDFSNMAGLDQIGSSSSYDQTQAPWQS